MKKKVKQEMKRFDFTLKMALSELQETRIAVDYVEAVCQLQELIELGYHIVGVKEYHAIYVYQVKIKDVSIGFEGEIEYWLEHNKATITNLTPLNDDEIHEKLEGDIFEFVEVMANNTDPEDLLTDNTTIEFSFTYEVEKEWRALWNY